MLHSLSYGLAPSITVIFLLRNIWMMISCKKRQKKWKRNNQRACNQLTNNLGIDWTEFWKKYNFYKGYFDIYIFYMDKLYGEKRCPIIGYTGCITGIFVSFEILSIFTAEACPVLFSLRVRVIVPCLIIWPMIQLYNRVISKSIFDLAIFLFNGSQFVRNFISK